MFEFFKKIPIRQKSLLLFPILVLGLWLIYVLAVADTVELIQYNIRVKKQVQNLSNAPQKIDMLQEQLQILERDLGGIDEDYIQHQDLLLEKVSHFCYKHYLALREFPHYQKEIDNSFEIYTTRIEVTGSFHNILKLTYYLEQEIQAGRVSSLLIEKRKDRKTRRIVLTGIIYLQNIRKQKVS